MLLAVAISLNARSKISLEGLNARWFDQWAQINGKKSTVNGQLNRKYKE